MNRAARGPFLSCYALKRGIRPGLCKVVIFMGSGTVRITIFQKS